MFGPADVFCLVRDTCSSAYHLYSALNQYNLLSFGIRLLTNNKHGLPKPPPEGHEGPYDSSSKHGPHGWLTFVGPAAAIALKPALVTAPLNRVRGTFHYLIFGQNTGKSILITFPASWKLNHVVDYLNRIGPFIRDNQVVSLLVAFLIFYSVKSALAADQANKTTSVPRSYALTLSPTLSLEEAEGIYVYIYNNINNPSLPRKVKDLLANYNSLEFRQIAVMEPGSLREKLVLSIAQDYRVKMQYL